MTSERTRHRLGDVLQLLLDHRGRTPKKLGGDFTPSGVPVLSAKKVKNGRIVLDDIRFVSEEMYERWMPTKLQQGDVLLTSEAPLGEVAYLPDAGPYCLGQRLFALRANPTAVNPRYLYYALRGSEMQHRLQGRASGTTVLGIRQTELLQVEIDLPPLAEQEFVADLLGALDDKIDANASAARAAEELAAALFDSCFLDFEGRETPVDSPIGPVPEGWRVVPLSEAVEINPRVPLERGAAVPFIEMAALPAWATRPTRLAERTFTGSGGARFAPGDTLLARITGCIENGKGSFVDFLPEAGFGSTEFIVLRAKPPLTPEAVFFLSRADFVRSHAIAHMTGSSGRQRVPVNAFDHLLVALPPELEAWREEADALRDCLALSRSLWEENRTLVELRDRLAPALLAGANLLAPVDVAS